MNGAFAFLDTHTCDRKDDSSADLYGLSPAPTGPIPHKSAGSTTTGSSKSSANRSKFACCNPNVLKYATKDDPCPGSKSQDLCELPALPTGSPNSPAPSFSDCQGSANAPRKQIKYRIPTSTTDASGAVNCDIDYAMNHASQTIQAQVNATKQSCIAVPNFFSALLNTITTLGISNAMTNNFTSAVFQHSNSCSGRSLQDRFLEGAFVDFDSLLDKCPDCMGRDKCLNYLLKGYLIGAGSDCCTNPNNCLQPVTPPLTADPCSSLPNPDKPALNKDGRVLVDEFGNTLFCPYTRCNFPTQNILAQYDDLVEVFLGTNMGENTHINLVAGEKKGVGANFGVTRAVHVKAENEGSKLCIKMFFTLGYSTMSCKPKTYEIINWPTWNFPCLSSQCTAKGSPTITDPINYSFNRPAAFNSITGRLMTCITETITNLVKGNPENCPNSMLLQFQLQMRDVVKACLILYIIILGISIAIRGDLPSKSELAIFVAKFAFVIWAAIGTYQASDVQQQQSECIGNKWCPTNGLEYIYTIAVAALESFPTMLISSVCDPEAGENCICSYPTSIYAEGYEYLALWDSLDCRISYYLGLNSPTTTGKEAMTAGAVAAATVVGGLMGFLFAFLFAFEILMLLLMLVFTIFLVSIVLFFINIYILCLLSITILVYMGPIFIPMILFKNTKSMFNSWIQQIMGYALQPMVITAFIAVMMVLFDNIIFGDCIFQQEYTSTGYRYWAIKCLQANGGCECSTTCQNTLGYLMARAGLGGMHWKAWPSDHAVLFTYPNFSGSADTFIALSNAYWQATIFGFLFYYFSKQLAGFAGDLTNSSSLGGQAISPTAVIDKAGGVAKSFGKAALARAAGRKNTLEQQQKQARGQISQSGMKGRAGDPPPTPAAEGKVGAGEGKSGMKGGMGKGSSANSVGSSSSGPTVGGGS